MKIRWGALMQSAIVLLGVATLVFFLFHAVAGDPARMMLGQVEDPVALKTLRAEYGLDKPLVVQYRNYLEGLSPLGYRFDGSWGWRWPNLQSSYQNKGVSVILMLSETLPNTALLAFTSICFALVIGIPIGLFAAANAGSRIDRFVVILSTTGMALPSFFSAVLIGWIFGYVLGPWTGLPMTGNLVEMDDFGEREVYNWHHIILPSFTLGIRPLGVIAQMMRASALEVLSQDYIRTAYAKGLTHGQVLRKHVFRNSLNPLVTTVSGWLAGLFSGAVFVESVFGWNGTGKMMVDALESRDFPVVMGCVLSLSAVFVVIQWFVEISYRWIDPRIIKE
ncbi:MAG: Dipeptide transport system permease protein DppB [Owenweeksia sp. TMED14]|nr:MAG: Dipeptide transport system permease protein DppB [Owenweeksia sp. TMED14]|tara:strand:+ start:1340 stop:2344 length:1005 start_codon:yes stop_codon:yes gene_type:complete